MHLLFGICKIADRDAGPVLAEAVGENSIVEDRPAQVDNRSFGCLQGTNPLDVNGLSCCIPNRYLDIAERLARICTQVIDQVGLPAQS